VIVLLNIFSYSGLCLLGWVFVLFCFPETAGLSLEEVSMIFKEGFGIKESERLRKEKKAIRDREMGKRAVEETV
jgi:MFS transporter, SP family, solute carrier family 2 (myo-inositol transporter), member 13